MVARDVVGEQREPEHPELVRGRGRRPARRSVEQLDELEHERTRAARVVEVGGRVCEHRSDPGGPPIPMGGIRNDIAAIIVGLILYGAFFFPFHSWVVGRPLLATAFGT